MRPTPMLDQALSPGWTQIANQRAPARRRQRDRSHLQIRNSQCSSFECKALLATARCILISVGRPWTRISDKQRTYGTVLALSMKVATPYSPAKKPMPPAQAPRACHYSQMMPLGTRLMKMPTALVQPPKHGCLPSYGKHHTAASRLGHGWLQLRTLVVGTLAVSWLCILISAVNRRLAQQGPYLCDQVELVEARLGIRGAVIPHQLVLLRKLQTHATSGVRHDNYW